MNKKTLPSLCWYSCETEKWSDTECPTSLVHLIYRLTVWKLTRLIWHTVRFKATAGLLRTKNLQFFRENHNMSGRAESKLNLIFLMHLFRTTAVANLTLIARKICVPFAHAQRVLSYHAIKVFICFYLNFR